MAASSYDLLCEALADRDREAKSKMGWLKHLVVGRLRISVAMAPRHPEYRRYFDHLNRFNVTSWIWGRDGRTAWQQK